MNDEEKATPDVELVETNLSYKKAFTDKGIAKLIELMTVGDVEVEFIGESITLRVLCEDQTMDEVLKLKFSNLIANSVYLIEQSADADPHQARCELYGLVGLLREAMEHVERAARGIDEHKWHDRYISRFIPIGDEYADLYLPHNEEEEDGDD